MNQDIEIVCYSQLSGFSNDEPGYGIFINCNKNRMNVGSIIPVGKEQVLLNIQILKEMQISNYEICEFSEIFNTIAAAVTAARRFLGWRKHIDSELRAAAASFAQTILDNTNKERPLLALVALDTHMRIFDSEGAYQIARALQDQIEMICSKLGKTFSQIRDELDLDG